MTRVSCHLDADTNTADNTDNTTAEDVDEKMRYLVMGGASISSYDHLNVLMFRYLN